MQRLHHAVFELKVHLVLVTKYRRKLLTKVLLEESRKLFERLVTQWGCELLEFGGEEDHVHLLLALRPDIQPSKLVNNLKTVSSRLIRRDHREYLARFYRKPVLWSASYCLVSCGGASLEKLKTYIENQETIEAKSN